MSAQTEQSRPPTPRAGRDLPAAIAVGVFLLGLAVATLMWWHAGFIVLLVLLTSLGAVELHQALRIFW